MLQSIVQERGFVTFPEHTFERVYMEPIYKDKPLPEMLSRWQGTVDAMLNGIDTYGVIYLMIDQGIVTPDKTHRRGGMHIDGYWVPAMSAHGGVGGGWQTPAPSRHNAHCTSGEWPVEGLLLASNVSACKALSGVYEDNIGDGGDCSHLDLSALSEHVLEANRVYAGNVTMLHESIPANVTAKRTLVRMNIPNWSPEIH